MKKKVLVCGSAGFLMSNFIRYLLYRSKEFEIVSIDKLVNPDDFKRIYLNKNHKFYIGDITDEYFMDRLISIEKPDWIVNGVGYFSTNIPNRIETHTKTIINSAIILSKYEIPTIQLAQDSCLDKYGYNFTSTKFTLKNGSMLILPNVFGLRQKPTIGLAKIIWDVKELGEVKFHSKKMPWVYAEDVASLIWYIIEKNIKQEIKMPPLGFVSLKTLIDIVCFELNLKPKIIEVGEISSFNNEFWEPMCFFPEKGSLYGYNWMPDSISLEASVQKTVSWYKANKWALRI